MPGLRINHVSVSSPDQDASARFYTDLFGAERLPAPNFGFRVDWFRFGDTQLHIFPEDDKAPKRHHLGISVDDILPVYRRAQELGVIDPVFTDHVRVLEDGNVSSTCATRAATCSRSTGRWATTRPTTYRSSSR